MHHKGQPAEDPRCRESAECFDQQVQQQRPDGCIDEAVFVKLASIHGFYFMERFFYFSVQFLKLIKFIHSLSPLSVS